MDIEELVGESQKNMVCPYFKTRKDSESATLLMCPYNYLLDPGTRKSLNASLENSVIIFDEGHNIESVCEN